MIGLRIGAILQPGAAAGIAFAGQQKALEAFRTAQGVGPFQQIEQGAGPQFLRPMAAQMLGADQHRKFPVLARHAQPLAERLDQRQTALLVAAMTGQFLVRRDALAEIVAQYREAGHVIRFQTHRLLQAQQHMHPGIDLRMVACRLGHAEQSVDFREYPRQRTAFAQHLDIPLRRRFLQGAFGLGPNSLRDQCIDFTAVHHSAHQRQSLGRDPEPQGSEARRQPGQTQNPHRVFDEGGRNMAQDALFQIAPTAERIDQAACGILGHGIDGEIAALQIVFQRHIGGGVNGEAVITCGGLALGTGQRVLLMGLGVQKHRKILADRPETARQQLFRGRTDHHPVAVFDRQPEQAIAYRATDDIAFHHDAFHHDRTHCITMMTPLFRDWIRFDHWRAVSILLAATMLGACTELRYYDQAVSGHLQLIEQRQPVRRMLAAPDLDPLLRQRLETATAIRAFATTELALPDNRSYTYYTDLGRSHVVYNVFAAPELALTPHEWCYPVIGCAAYRGYFARADAEREAARLAEQGFDVFVAGVPAYSTLGCFADPLLNTFIHWPEGLLAELIFHELAHQQLFIAGDTVFNESFATTVGELGAEHWLRGRPEALDEYRRLKRYRADFLALVQTGRAELEALYASDMPKDRMRARKAEQLADLQARYERLKQQRWQGFSGYDRWVGEGFNNAKLASLQSYTQYVPAFYELFRREGEDFAALYRAAERIGRLPPAQRTRALDALTLDAPSVTVNTAELAVLSADAFLAE